MGVEGAAKPAIGSAGALSGVVEDQHCCLVSGSHPQSRQLQPDSPPHQLATRPTALLVNDDNFHQIASEYLGLAAPIFIGMDTETTGLLPYYGDRLVGVALYVPEWGVGPLLPGGSRRRYAVGCGDEPIRSASPGDAEANRDTGSTRE